jgi:hypothetical protein
MPRSTDPDHYPQEYIDVATLAATQNKSTTIEFPTLAAALKLKAHYISGFIASMKRIRDRVESTGRLPNEREAKWLDTLNIVRKVEVYLEKRADGTATITFRSKAHSDYALAIRHGLVRQEAPLKQTEGERQFNETLMKIAKETHFGAGGAVIQGVGPITELSQLSPEAKERLAGYGNRRVLRNEPGDKDDKG